MSTGAQATLKSNAEPVKYGMFAGVFVPNILTILGVIMYLRMGWVVGHAGLWNFLLILTIAQSITLFTSLSMSAIATNMRVKAGGAYYIISRSFGVEAGGSVGLPLYVSQTLGIGLYIVGFSESVQALFPSFSVPVIGLTALVVLGFLTLKNPDLIMKGQYVIMAVIALSLVAFFTGFVPHFDSIRLQADWGEQQNFWSVFAVFFPAVTGILSGVSMSGDLKNPAQSIPWGTLWAVVTGWLIYLTLGIWLLASGSMDLKTDMNLMSKLSVWPPFIFAGIWGATLSSAAASLLAAPRTLQALARDGVVFRFLGRGHGPSDNPLVATALTFGFAVVVVAGAKLDVIAPVLTMFFLITYGSLNLIAFVESVIRRPSYRPKFKVHWSVSLVGAVGCFWVMLVINPLAFAVGALLVLTLYLVLKRIQMQKNWGDVWRGFYTQIIKFSLRKMARLSYHHQNWRPFILAFIQGEEHRATMVQVADSLTRDHGLLSFVNVLGKAHEGRSQELQRRALEFQEFLRDEGVESFTSFVYSDHVIEAQQIAAQSHGVGDFRQNTVLLPWGTHQKRWFGTIGSDLAHQFKMIRLFKRLNMSLLFVHPNRIEQGEHKFFIDLWWDPSKQQGSFMLLLAHLLVNSARWRGAKIRLKSVVLEDQVEKTRVLLQELVDQSRIEAEIQVYYPRLEELDEQEMMRIQSKYMQGPPRPEDFQKTQQQTRGWLGKVRRWKKRLSEEMVSTREELLTALEQEEKELFDLQHSAEAEERATEEEFDTQEDPLETEEKLDEAVQDDSPESQVQHALAEQLGDFEKEVLAQCMEQIIVQNSQSSDLVILDFALPEKGEEKNYLTKLDQLLDQLPTTLLVHGPEDFRL